MYEEEMLIPMPMLPFDGGDDEGEGEGEGDDAATAAKLKKLEDDLAAEREEKAKVAKNNKALKEQLDAQREKSTEFEKRLAEIEGDKETERMKAQEAAGEISQLNTSWQEKYDRTRAEYDEKIEKLTADNTAENDRLKGVVVDVTSKREAALIAADLALPGHQDVLRPHIEARLKTEWEDGIPVVKIMGANGEASALTMDEFKDEIKATEGYKPLLMGHKSSGAGGGPGDGGGDNGDARTMARSEFDGMTVDQRSSFFQDEANKGVRVVDG